MNIKIGQIKNLKWQTWAMLLTLIVASGVVSYYTNVSVNLDIQLQAILDRLETTINSTWYALQKTFDYILSVVQSGGNTYYCAQNGSTGKLATYGTNSTHIMQYTVDYGNSTFIRNNINFNSSILLDSDQAIEGYGWQTILSLADGVDDSLFKFKATGEENIVLKNLQLYGNRDGQSAESHGIYSGGSGTVNWLTLDHIFVTNFYTQGLRLFGNYSHIISSCFEDNGDMGAYIIYSNHTIIENSYFLSNVADGLYLGWCWNTIVGSSNHLCLNGRHGLSITALNDGSYSITVSNNIFDSNTRRAIDVEHGTLDNLIISDNQITNNGYDGIVCLGMTNSLIHDNIIYNNGAGVAGQAGIRLLDGVDGGSASTWNKISGNNIRGNEDYGIFEDENSDYNTFIDNNCILNTGTSNMTISGANSKVNLCWNGTSWIA